LGNNVRWGNQIRSEQITACFSPNPDTNSPSRTRAAPSCERRLVVRTRRRPLLDQSTTAERRADDNAWCETPSESSSASENDGGDASPVFTPSPPPSLPSRSYRGARTPKLKNAPTRPLFAAGSCQTAPRPGRHGIGKARRHPTPGVHHTPRDAVRRAWRDGVRRNERTSGPISCGKEEDNGAPKRPGFTHLSVRVSR